MPEFTIDFTGPFVRNASEILAPLAQQRVQYLELGVLEGRSAVWMLEHILTNRRASYTGIDGYVMTRKKAQRTQHLAKQNLAPYREKARFLIGRSERLLPTLLAEGRRYDVIYIDGDHTGLGVATDMAYGWRMLKPGGILAVDDMRHPKFKDVRRVVRALLQGLPHDVLADNEQLWVRKQ